MNLIPSTPAKIFDLTAIAIGFLLIDESTPAEQNSLGNWLMLIGQVLCTNSAQQQVLNNRNGSSNSSNQHVINSNINGNNNSNMNNQIEMMNKVIQAMQKEINDLKFK
jgi:hypothetical protein